MGGNGNKNLVTGREWELNLRHHGNGIGNGNELMGMGGNGNVASHSRTSLVKMNRTANIQVKSHLVLRTQTQTNRLLYLDH